ncbi:MAG: dihydroorotate dehydrogenase [Candidatus Bathyarchaeia archaeon]|nr:dihydroorotate dehydrogenase [Candidatus Bathyarchaeota archaeon]
MDTSIELTKIKFNSPLILASGVSGYSKYSFKRAEKSGAGGVVTKSSSLKPRYGYSGPTIVELPYGLLNAMGLPNPGVKKVSEEIYAAKKLLKVKIPLIASIYGFNLKEYVKAAEIAAEYADAVELNFSCPTVKKVSVEIGQNSRKVKEIIKAVKNSVEKPIFAKLSPNVSNIVEMGKAAEKGGADAITAINTINAMALNIDLMKPILSAKIGGLSGPCIKPIALRCVYELYENVNVPIIGCGGILNWEDVIEMFLAGASAVQIGTGIKYKGFEIFKELNLGIKHYLRLKGYKSLKEIKGLAHKK